MTSLTSPGLYDIDSVSFEHVVNAGQGPVLLVNRSSTATIVLSDAEGFDQAGNSVIVLDPAGSQAVDGETDLWASCLAAGTTAILNAVPGGLSQFSPALVAAQIAATGVPLLSKATTVFNQASQSVAGGTTFTVPGSPFAVSQIGYEVFVSVQASAGASAPFAQIQMTWSDSVSGNVVAQETWWLAGAAPPLFNKFSGTGPTKGNQLTVTITNPDATHALQVAMTVLQVSRVFVRDDWRQITYNTPPGFTAGIVDQQAGFLLSTAPTIGAGSAATRIIPLYAGRVKLWATGPVAYDLTINAIDPNISAAPAGNQIYEANITAAGGAKITDYVALPRCTCTIAIQNNGATGQQFGANLIIEESPA